MHKLVLLRHGESIWNKKNKFTGWTDVDLSEKGILEAHESAELLQKEGFTFDIVFTSVLKRAIRTLWIVMDDMDMMWLPVERSWRLNERHYGALQGLNKKETADKYGEKQVIIWRRSYDTRPPALTKDDPRYPGNELMYANVPKKDLPLTECLKDTVARFLPYWKDTIIPAIKQGKKYLDNISDEEIVELNIPTGIPLIYELDNDLKAQTHYYLGDQEKVQQAINSVKNQIRKK